MTGPYNPWNNPYLPDDPYYGRVCSGRGVKNDVLQILETGPFASADEFPL